MIFAWCALVISAGLTSGRGEGSAHATLVAASAAPTDAIASAQAALSGGDFAAAERSALEALQTNPNSGPALLLLGLARFKQNRPADALEAFDRAAAAPDVPDPAMADYDRGSCLTALGRPEDAEQAFLRAAARNTDLAPVAEVSAGLAALDAGALDRARADADRAAARSGPPGLADLVSDLRSQIAAAERRAADDAADRAADLADAAADEGMTHFSAERYAEAERSFLRATELDPSTGMHHLMAGAAAFHNGHRATARAQLEEALRLGLDPAAAAAAREYLDGLSPGLRGRGEGLALRAAVDTGVDTNVLQSGLGFTEILGPLPGRFGRPPGASPFASVLVGAAYRHGLGDALFGELTYAFDQVLYAAPPYAEDSLQQHALAGTVEIALRPHARLSLGVLADSFSQGLFSFQGVQWGAGGAAGGAFDEADWLTARAKLEITRKRAFSGDTSEYSGARADATLAQDFRWPRAALTAAYRHREERIGTLLRTETGTPPDVLCPAAGCDQIKSRVNVIPFAYRSNLFTATAAAILPRRIRGTAELGLEWRDYLEDSYLLVTFADGSTLEADHRRRQDLRFTASFTAALPLGGGLELGARYDLSIAGSNVDSRLMEPSCLPPDYACHQLDYGSQSFHKHVLSVSLSYVR